MYFKLSLFFFHLPFTVPLSLAHLYVFHFVSASAWFLLSGPLTYNYFRVFVSMVSLAFVNPPFFLHQPLVSVYLDITLPDSFHQKVTRDQTGNSKEDCSLTFFETLA